MTDPTPLTDDELRAIEARCEAATPGPWTTEPPDYTAPSWVNAGDCNVQVFTGGMGVIGDLSPHGRQIHNAEFIAAARTDVPKLIAAVRERDAEIERLKLRVGYAKVTDAQIEAMLAEAKVACETFKPGNRSHTIASGAIALAAELKRVRAELAAAEKALATPTLWEAEKQRDAALAEVERLRAELAETQALEMNHEGAILRVIAERDRAEAAADLRREERDAATAEATQLRAELAEVLRERDADIAVSVEIATDKLRADLARAVELLREYTATVNTLTALRSENAPRSDYARKQGELEDEIRAFLAEQWRKCAST